MFFLLLFYNLFIYVIIIYIIYIIYVVLLTSIPQYDIDIYIHCSPI